jgi:hypothetical protein
MKPSGRSETVVVGAAIEPSRPMAGNALATLEDHQFRAPGHGWAFAFPELAQSEVFLQRKTRLLSGRGRHRASLTPFNLAEATD